MPERDYGFKLDPDEMSFGALMIHIARSQALRRGFDFCIETLPKLGAEQLDRMYRVDWFERPVVSGRQLIPGTFTHTAHHRGEAEVCLRAKGIKPPACRF
jgi:uncharacterized damage-inducible protein DinB